MKKLHKLLALGLLATALTSLAAFQAYADDDEDEKQEYSEHKGDKGRGEHGEKGEAKNLGVKLTNETWKTECSACHMAYPPGLLPAASWQALMGDLPNHFGTDASLDDQAMKEILPFLTENAASERRQETNKDGKPMLRITETQWFKKEHDEISAATWKSDKVKSASNCLACHTTAEQGNFDEDNVKIPR